MIPVAQLLGECPSMTAVRGQLTRLLGHPSAVGRRVPPILILGETGTGKGLVADTLHRAGPRARGPFVDVNCAAIPETLLEAELFGYERGAFTDAKRSKPGLFQTAHGGTIFLDEIGLMPVALQSKLLRVIEERQVRRLGGTRSEPVDAWVIAATGEDLKEAIRARRFRRDLYHRLAVVTLELPPLRDRGADAITLAEHFLTKACDDYGVPAKVLAPDARAALAEHPWPGNVRELANVIERAALLTDGTVITAAALGLDAEGQDPRPPARRPALVGMLREVERTHLLQALEASGGNITQAAARLGVPRNTLRYRLGKHGLALDTDPVRRRGGRPPRDGVRTEPQAPMQPPDLRWKSRRLTWVRATIETPTATLLSSEVTRTLEAIVDKAQSFGGHIYEIQPSSVTVAFGLDVSEGAGRRGLQAAVAVRTLADRARRDNRESPGLSCVVHAALAMVAEDAVEPVVEPESARSAAAVLDGLLAKAAPGAIVVSRGVRALVERYFLLEALDGTERDDSAYRLENQAEREPLRRSFVGRDAELGLLAERFAQARAGKGQVFTIVGEPGVGKSRLLREFRARIRGEAAWVEGRSLPFGGSMPLHPVVEMARRVCRIDEGDSESTVVSKLEQYVRRLDGELVSALPFLRVLVGVPSGDPAVDAMNPRLCRVETFDGLDRVLGRAASMKPQVVVVEDAHWMDPATEEWLTRLAERVSAQAVLLLVTYRPGFSLRLGDHTFHTRLALGTLSPEESRRMARDLLAAEELPAALEDLFDWKAEGNPFFVEEMARWLGEVGVVRREGARVVFAKSAIETRVPDTIHDLILSRIDRLREAARQTLRVASVIGREFSRSLLEDVLEGAALDEPLRELRTVELVYERRAFPDIVYRFKHALTHEVAYASVPLDERRALHRRIAALLETVRGERREQAAILARHYLAAEDWDRALAKLRRRALRRRFDSSRRLRAYAGVRTRHFRCTSLRRATERSAADRVDGAMSAYREEEALQREHAGVRDRRDVKLRPLCGQHALQPARADVSSARPSAHRSTRMSFSPGRKRFIWSHASVPA